MKDNFAILVNSTDSFEDCWTPFFKLFKTFWPDYSGTIYLNTEEKHFVYEGLNIVSIQSGLTGSSWSKCLDFAIHQIKEDSFIYMQEDYFLRSNVDHKQVLDLHMAFTYNKLDCLHLTDQCTKGPFIKDSVGEGLWAIKKGARYRASTQAAFWKKESLIKIIRPWESGWEFEEFGTDRSCKLLSKVFCVSQDLCKKDEIEVLPYIFTGIIKGKWKPEVVPLFKYYGIHIDFTKRGFVEDADTNLISRLQSLLKILKRQIKNKVFEALYINKRRANS